MSDVTPVGVYEIGVLVPLVAEAPTMYLDCDEVPLDGADDGAVPIRQNSLLVVPERISVLRVAVDQAQRKVLHETRVGFRQAFAFFVEETPLAGVAPLTERSLPLPLRAAQLVTRDAALGPLRHDSHSSSDDATGLKRRVAAGWRGRFPRTQPENTPDDVRAGLAEMRKFLTGVRR
jgi:hypothetical protein